MSKRIKVIFPVPLSEHTRELIESQIPPAYIRPEFDVEFVGSKRLMTLASVGRKERRDAPDAGRDLTIPFAQTVELDGGGSTFGTNRSPVTRSKVSM